MPNHCSNEFYFSGSRKDIERLYAHIVNPDGEDGQPAIDFNRIIPMPEELAISCDSIGTSSATLLQLDPQALLKDQPAANLERLHAVLTEHGRRWESVTVGQAIQFLREHPETAAKLNFNLALGEQYLRNKEKHGFPNWYGWCNWHWGTKWNAYSCYCKLSEDHTEFFGYLETAWSPPEPIYEKLAEEYPNVRMCIRYIDEGGFFAGTYESDGDGEGVLHDYPVEGDEAFKDFAQTHFGWTFDEDNQDEE